MTAIVRRLEIANGRIRTWRSDGVKTFDSDERMFQIASEVSGTLSLPARATAVNNPGQSAAYYLDRDVVLTDVHTSCNALWGSFRVSTTGYAVGVADKGWYAAGGTYVHAQSINNEAVAGGSMTYVRMAGYTFFVRDSQLWFNEHVYLSATPSTDKAFGAAGLRAVTLDYYLFCGSFV